MFLSCVQFFSYPKKCIFKTFPMVYCTFHLVENYSCNERHKVLAPISPMISPYFCNFKRQKFFWNSITFGPSVRMVWNFQTLNNILKGFLTIPKMPLIDPSIREILVQVQTNMHIRQNKNKKYRLSCIDVHP